MSHIYNIKWLSIIAVVWIVGVVVGGLLTMKITNSAILLEIGLFIGFIFGSLVNYLLIKKFA